MQYPAQLAESILFLKEALTQSYPVDQQMARYFKARRYIGSKDKGVIADMVYLIMREKDQLTWLLTQLDAEITARNYVLMALRHLHKLSLNKLAEHFGSTTYAAEALSADEEEMLKAYKRIDLTQMPEAVQLGLPEWLVAKFKDIYPTNYQEEALAFKTSAPLDIRVNKLKTSRTALLKLLNEQGFAFEKTKRSPFGLRMQERKSLFGTDAFQNGLLEVQDEGSQLIALMAGAQKGMRVVDFCSGAGGKTLAMAMMMQNKGKVDACDINARRMKELKPRLVRAGIDTVQSHLLESERDAWVKRQKGKADVVLLDVPCTGTGTWRRNPDMKWKLTEEDVQELMSTQKSILESASRMVKVGGALVYATCSVLKEENEQQIESFLVSHPQFSLESAQDFWTKTYDVACPFEGDMMRLSPAKHQTDGFFAARLVRTS